VHVSHRHAMEIVNASLALATTVAEFREWVTAEIGAAAQAARLQEAVADEERGAGRSASRVNAASVRGTSAAVQVKHRNTARRARHPRLPVRRRPRRLRAAQRGRHAEPLSWANPLGRIVAFLPSSRATTTSAPITDAGPIVAAHASATGRGRMERSA